MQDHVRSGAAPRAALHGVRLVMADGIAKMGPPSGLAVTQILVAHTIRCPFLYKNIKDSNGSGLHRSKS